MKTRSKLLLAAVSLLTVSVAATATSAYAWYTANRQVEATVNSLGVHSTTGSLTIVHDTSITQTSTDSKEVTKSGADLTYTTASTLTDVSSKGDGTFIKPKWNAKGDICVGTYDQSDDPNPNKTVPLYGSERAYGVVSLGVMFKNEGTPNVSDDMVLYLDPEVTVTATSSTDKMTSDSVVNSARFSICEVKEDGTVDSVYLYGNPKSGTGESKEVNHYVSVETDDTVKFDNEITGNVVDESNLINTSNPSSKRVTDPTGNQTYDKGYLCTIPANKTHRYLITMWVEGTDDDCKFGKSVTDSFAVSGLSISLGFYALTSEPTPQQVA